MDNDNKIIETFTVTQMTCASCVATVESTIKRLDGVIDASVNFATETVTIEYYPSKASPIDFRNTVKAAGYDMIIEKSAKDNSTLDKQNIKKIKSLKKRTFLAGIFTLPVVIIGMFFMDIPYANMIMWVLTTPVLIWFGQSFFINAFKKLKRLSANMDTLVALSTGIAYLFSTFNTFYPEFWISKGLHAHVYFEAAAVIITFILLGRLLEEKAKGNTSSAIRKLIGMKPKTVIILDKNNKQHKVSIEKVVKGDTILVKPGEKIAVDGIVKKGVSNVDESMLSGEAIPVLKKEGDNVFAGTINQKGSFLFCAEKVGSETMLSQIIKMVQEAQGSKAPVQRAVDKIASIFVPVVIVISIVSFVLWLIYGGENAFSQGLIAMITVLIIACPCALGLATPTAIMVGIGKGAEKGILIKDAESLELAKKINAVVLDKTGTITEGKPKLTDIKWLHKDDSTKDILFNIEKQSEHPLADAIVEYFNSSEDFPVMDFKSITGVGAKATVKNRSYFVGNSKHLKENSITVSDELQNKAKKWSEEAKTVVWFTNDKEALAVMAIADTIKKTSGEAIQMLNQLGIDVYMLTGDSKDTAQAIASKAGIKNYRASFLPEDKSSFVKELQNKGKIVAMVGDGINDSAALAQSDVSIAMGKGSDIAIDVAKMTIISSDLKKIPEAVKLSGQTVKAVRQNLFWAFIYNTLGIPVAAGILYPFTGFLLNPMIAGAAMALSSLSVVGNSLRLKLKK